MQKHILYILFFSSFCMVSCEDFFTTTVTLDLPEVDDILVVNAIVKINEPIQFQLSKTQGILESGNTYEQTVDNGTISLSKAGVLLENITSIPSVRIDSFYNGYQVDEDGNFIVEYIYDTTAVNLYKSTVVAEAGATYELKANAPGFEEVISTTTLPNLTSVKRAWIADTSIQNNIYENIRLIDIVIEFDDNPNEENFYFLNILRRQTFEIEGTDEVQYNQGYSCFTSIDPSFIEEETGDIEIEVSEPFFCSSANLLSDGTFNGETKKIKVSLQQYDYQYYGGGEENQVELYVTLGSISKDFFLFKKSAFQQSWLEGNPFAEPVQVYSNMEGGLGIFAGYGLEVTKVEE